MDTVDIQAVESKLCDVTVTAVPMIKATHQQGQNHNNGNVHRECHTPVSTNNSSASVGLPSPQQGLSKYAQLLNVIEEMGKEVRPTYAGSRSSAERLKRSIVSARILVKECLIETERSARQ